MHRPDSNSGVIAPALALHVSLSGAVPLAASSIMNACGRP